jgi:hypothetical protein
VLVAHARGESQHGRVVEAEVEDRLEHPRHRVPCARAHGDQQRVVGIAEPASRALLEPGDPLGDLLGQPGRLDAAVAHEGHAGLGRDGEARGHEIGAQDAGHLGDVRALAAEQHAHVARALREVVHVASGAGDRGHEAILEAARPRHMRRSYGLRSARTAQPARVRRGCPAIGSAPRTARGKSAPRVRQAPDGSRRGQALSSKGAARTSRPPGGRPVRARPAPRSRGSRRPPPRPGGPGRRAAR